MPVSGSSRTAKVPEGIQLDREWRSATSDLERLTRDVDRACESPSSQVLVQSSAQLANLCAVLLTPVTELEFMKIEYPSEHDEQIAFVQFLDMLGLRYTAIPNATWTKSWSQKAKNHAEGLRPGFPDLIVLIPAHRSNDGQGHLLAIEMKKRAGGRLSDVQSAWIASLNALGSPSIDAVVCKGAAEAIELICSYLEHPMVDDSPF